MNIYLNYLLEANLALCIFMALYIVVLRNETNFQWKRGFLLLAIIASVGLPLLHFNATRHVVPLLSDMVPPTWLPEITIHGSNEVAGQTTDTTYTAWSYITIVYGSGIILCLALFMFRLSRLLTKCYRASAYRYDDLLIIESTENKSAFSFFRYIFIGQADQLSNVEKLQIIEHERVHAHQLHSIDILLVNLLGIFFWFNPVIIVYKKIFIQLHEFEADARAVANRDMNEYCSLLAKVALLSADFKLANHFSNSLTVKRIEMMRTIKSKIKGWKVAAILSMLPVIFFIVSCQDQVASEAQDIAKNSTMALDIPKEVEMRLEQMRMAHPDKKFIVIEPDANAVDKAADLQRKTGALDPSQIVSMDVMKNIQDKNGNARSFIIIEYNETTEKVASSAVKDGEIFTVVEETATFDGGFEAIGSFLSSHLEYPEELREQGVEGKVFVQFVVNTDGSLSNFEVIRSSDARLNDAALGAVRSMPHWNPGKQKGVAVRQQFVLPIVFALNSGSKNTAG
ncbi:MAG TPA: M56 family metallopeptidase [Ohtaekwangia sp.]|uniref:M56 family metallopeptidase n=1 Tax=Ohtaekwangia sp. TaxID=2066019 RepID=UPI002F94BE12